MNELSFLVLPFRDGAYDEPPHEVIPLVDGERLDDLIDRFERSRGMSPREDYYGGLVWEWFKWGPTETYFMPATEGEEDVWRPDGRSWLLSCGCGEAGCWPLEAHITATGNLISWDSFAQPHRRERDYDGFGPFHFSRAKYVGALEKLAKRLLEPA